MTVAGEGTLRAEQLWPARVTIDLAAIGGALSTDLAQICCRVRDERLHRRAGDIVRTRTEQHATRMGVLVEFEQGAVSEHPVDQRGDIARLAGTGRRGDRLTGSPG